MEKTRLKTVNIKGKQYVETSTRIEFFRENYPEYSIVTEIVDLNANTAVFKASILDSNGKVRATGFAHENKNGSFINGTSYVENCETSAIGRALGLFGIGLCGSGIASADEVTNAINNQKNN